MIQWQQVPLLTLYSTYQICDELTNRFMQVSPIRCSFITGLIMGDVTTGCLSVAAYSCSFSGFERSFGGQL